MDSTQNTDKSQIHPNSLANLKLWQPGQSGNPGGRPKKRLLDEHLTEMLEENPAQARSIAKALIEKAAAGDTRTAQLIAERTQGKPTQKVEVSGNEGGPLSLAVSFVKSNAG